MQKTPGLTPRRLLHGLIKGLPKVSWGLELGADLIGAASTVDSSLSGLILEITMKPGEIDMRFKAFHL